MGKTELKLSIDAKLLAEARRAEISLDAALEAGLKLALAQADRPLTLGAAESDPATGEVRAETWARENAEGIRAFNERIERRGVFGADLRRW